MKTLFILTLFNFGLTGFASPIPFMALTSPLLNVPSVPQSTNYSCGPAALLAVLNYYGMGDYHETFLMEKAGTTPKDGTDLDRLVALSNELGLMASWHTNATIDELNRNLAAKNPVIVDLQAWPDKPISSAATQWDDGHYIVLIGSDAENLYFSDPSLVGSRGYIPISTFIERWHDTGTNGVKLEHAIIVFEGTPNPPPTWAPIP